jgi:hypothetical protein
MLLCGCATKTPQMQTEDQNIAFLRSRTPLVVQYACTNNVVGLKQIVDMDIDDASADVGKWTATATVEYLDKDGSEQEKKLGYTFLNTGDDLYCLRIY